MLTIKQNCGCKIINDSRTIEWLVENTKVRTFDNINFTGYQRKVNENHVLRIVNYLKENTFYLPTSIICASAVKNVNKNTELYIVDGQHRVEAFKKLKETDINIYDDIKNYELSVIILEKPSKALEIDTFITINKTSRKVDTSLAYILKNISNIDNTDSRDLTVAKREFLAVELAIRINKDDNSLWNNKILLEGNPTVNTYETISLNSFVKSNRVLISYLGKFNIIKLDWKNDKELNNLLDEIKTIYLNLWDEIKFKWPNLFISGRIKNTVLQGTIGVSAINKYIIMKLKSLDKDACTLEEFNTFVGQWIQMLNVSEELWYKGNSFSKFSSEAGFNLVAKSLFDSFAN